MTYFRLSETQHDELVHKIRARGAGAPNSGEDLAVVYDVVLCDRIIDLLNNDVSEGR